MKNTIPDLMSALSHLFRAQLRHAPGLDASGLAPFQAKVLMVIDRRPDTTPRQLADHSGRDKAQVARVLKDLESRGLITRHPDPTDGRVSRLALTETGARAVEALCHRRQAIAEQMLSEVSEDEQAALIKTLEKMRAALEKTD
jgi:DNA-binding MarR family transcriptional regulator